MPDDVGFATKITLGRRMLARALDAGVPAAWATADEFYGGDRRLRRDLQARGVGYVLAVAKSHRVTPAPIGGPLRADRLAATLPTRALEPALRRQRVQRRAGLRLGLDRASPHPPTRPPGSTACWSAAASATANWPSTAAGHPQPVPCATLVRVAGTRWCVEECFQAGKGEVGLDQHQVRRWDSWYRYTTLVMLAHAILTVIAARERDHRTATDDALIPLTVNEIRRLFGAIVKTCGLVTM